MLQQILYVLGTILITPFFPLLIFMGKKVRKNIPELPEASENINGKIEGKNGEIRLLSMGESTIAGVGVTDHKDGITGQFAKTLHDLTKKTVHWQVLARNGYTAERVNLKLVPRLPEYPLDIILIGLGGNDTFHFNSPFTFKKQLILTIQNIQKRQPKAKIVIANMPPIGEFPAFPWLIQRVLGSLVDLHGAVIRDVPQRFENVFYVNEKITFKKWIKRADKDLTPTDFFSDGVHPSAMTYGMWGKEIGHFIMKNIDSK
jgi:lysophospholipase L1-like esterase